MSLSVYLRLKAAEERRAVPRASRRHSHISERPMVIVGYHLAGEPGAPVALMYGVNPDEPNLIAIAEPRNRDQRFAALGTFAKDLRTYLDQFGLKETVERAKGPSQVCVDAPQIAVANTASAAWITDLLGRSLRYLRTDGPNAVDPILPLLGADLTWFATRRVLPGTSSVVAATDLLTTHWTTGQLPVEDANLATVLAWVRPPLGQDAPAAAQVAEGLPPAGPASDPAWDRDRLQGSLGDLAAVHDACDEALAPAWRQTWEALDLVGRLPVAAHVAKRWESDRLAWTRHLDRVAEGGAYFSRRLDQLNAFRLLSELEKRTTALERQMALDDERIMAQHIVDGEAIAGELVRRETDNWVPLATGRRGLRPLLTLRTTVPYEGPLHTEFGWARKPSVKAEVIAADGETATLRVFAGACRSEETAAEILPRHGESVAFATFASEEYFPDNLPEELPWTHTPPDSDEGDEV